jgi:hypothetical protein
MTMTQSTYLDVEFDVDAEEGSSFDLLPAGRYYAEVAKITSGPTKSNNGNAINIQWRISQGDFAGRTVFQSILWQHESAQAEKFGKQRLKDLCVAMGVTGKLSDLTVFCHREVQILVGIRQDKTGRYPDKNDVKRVMPLETVKARPNDPISTGNGELNDRVLF